MSRSTCLFGLCTFPTPIIENIILLSDINFADIEYRLVCKNTGFYRLKAVKRTLSVGILHI